MHFDNRAALRGHSCGLISAVLVSLSLAACQSAQSRAQHAYDRYQAALASNDLSGARRALQEVTATKDDVPENWSELGHLDLQTGRYGDAYYAFSRAHELDRSNPELLRFLTQIALQSGKLADAQKNARELDPLSPKDPWVKMVAGYTALNEHRFKDAQGAADSILATAPSDPGATILKARALMGDDQTPAALALLEAHVGNLPTDSGSWKLLTRMYERSGGWRNVARAAGHSMQNSPTDYDAALLYILASLRSSNFASARQASLLLLKPNANPMIVSGVLDRWADYWPSAQRISDARQLAQQANPTLKIVYAAFLNRVGSPADGLSLTAPLATLPIQAASVEANAVAGDALWRTGRWPEGRLRLDAVLSFDSGNATALRSRAELSLKSGQAKAAVADAQKLVTVAPQSSRDRLLLSRCFEAAGDQRQAQNSLWDAFHQIEANESILAAIKRSKSGNADAIRQLDEEYVLQRDAVLSRVLS